MKVIFLVFEDEDESIAFKIQELIQAASKVTYGTLHQPAKLSVLDIQKQQHKVLYQNRQVYLTKTEFEILLYLSENLEQVLSHTQIYEHVWKEPDYGMASKTVARHIYAIRKKLQISSDSPVRIDCFRGVGYRLTVDAP